MIAETCACGATFTAQYVSGALERSALRDFRAAHAACRPRKPGRRRKLGHLLDEPAAPAPVTEGDSDAAS